MALFSGLIGLVVSGVGFTPLLLKASCPKKRVDWLNIPPLMPPPAMPSTCAGEGGEGGRQGRGGAFGGG